MGRFMHNAEKEIPPKGPPGEPPPGRAPKDGAATMKT